MARFLHAEEEYVTKALKAENRVLKCITLTLSCDSFVGLSASQILLSIQSLSEKSAGNDLCWNDVRLNILTSVESKTKDIERKLDYLENLLDISDLTAGKREAKIQKCNGQIQKCDGQLTKKSAVS